MVWILSKTTFFTFNSLFVVRIDTYEFKAFFSVPDDMLMAVMAIPH